MSFKKAIIPLALAATCAQSSENLYGFIKASFMNVEGASKDYKPFFAVKDATGNEDYDDTSHTQLSVKQSRFGMRFTQDKVAAKIEFDFDGEAGNSPGATSSDKGNLRTRILEIQYSPTKKDRISMGKRWDTFAAYNPHTYSVTMVQLFQGNTGFLTEGLEYKRSFDGLDFFLQLQSLGDEAAYKVSLPIATARFDYTANDKHKFGVAFKSGNVNTKDANTTQENVEISGAKLFYSGELLNTKIISEVYTGKNLGAATIGASVANISPSSASSLTGPAGGGADIEDSGFYLSMKKQFEKLGVFAGYGQSSLSNAKDDLSDQAKTFNSATRAGVDFLAEKNLTLFTELTSIRTGYFDQTNNKTNYQNASMLELGMLYKF